MQPDVEALIMFPWYVWWVLIIGLTLFTFVGTWLVTRRWPE